MKVELYPQNGNNKFSDANGSAIPALLAGKLDIVMDSSTAYVVPTGVKELQVFDMPFLFRSYKEADTILDGPIGQDVLQKLQTKGLQGIGYEEVGFRVFFNNVRPINRPADMQDLRIRSINNPIYLKTFEALGAKPKPLGYPKLYEALKNKEFDGADMPVTIGYDTKFYEVQKYMSLVNYVYTPAIVSANKKWWDSLSAGEHKIISDAMIKARDYSRIENRRQIQANTAEMQAKGMQVNTVSKQNTMHFNNKLAKISSEIAKGIGIEWWIRINQALNTLRKE